MNATQEIRRAVGWSIALSVLMIVAGVAAIVVPQVSSIAVTVLVGGLLVFCGATHLAYAWHTRKGGGLWWGLLLGLIYVSAGSYLLLHPLAGRASLTVVLAAFLFLAALLEFTLAFYLRPLSGSGWLLIDGIITLALAILICGSWPESAEWVLGVLMGISMLFSGVARLMLSLTARRLADAFP
jgi:uncharacterized membrane protein HdeD (DUF308 family)